MLNPSQILCRLKPYILSVCEQEVEQLNRARTSTLNISDRHSTHTECHQSIYEKGLCGLWAVLGAEKAP